MHMHLSNKKDTIRFELPREKTGFFLPMRKQRRNQLCSNCEADQRLCFRYTDNTISLLLTSEIASFYPASVTVQISLCQTCRKSRRPFNSRRGFFVNKKTFIEDSRHRFNVINIIEIIA